MKQQPLEGKVALITGAARGIGYGIAKRFAEEGASVMLTDILDDLNEQSASRLRGETGRDIAHKHCDVTDRAQVDEAIAATVQRFGALDIAVSNAGICPFVDFLDLDNATWQKTIDVILTGSFNIGQASARAMIAGKRPGQIIYITSASTIQATGNQVDYAAAKSGERMLMASMATAMGKYGITVNAVSPGVVHTEMGAHHWDIAENRERFGKTNPVGRLALPSDIANAALFLTLDESAYITAASIRVDGGLTPIG